MSKRVEIHGTSRADVNGKRGVAVDFHLVNAKDPTDQLHEQVDQNYEKTQVFS